MPTLTPSRTSSVGTMMLQRGVGVVATVGKFETPEGLTPSMREFFAGLPHDAQRAFLTVYEGGRFAPDGPRMEGDVVVGSYLVAHVGEEDTALVAQAYAENPEETALLVEVRGAGGRSYADILTEKAKERRAERIEARFGIPRGEGQEERYREHLAVVRAESRLGLPPAETLEPYEHMFSLASETGTVLSISSIATAYNSDPAAVRRIDLREIKEQMDKEWEIRMKNYQASNDAAISYYTDKILALEKEINDESSLARGLHLRFKQVRVFFAGEYFRLRNFFAPDSPFDAATSFGTASNAAEVMESLLLRVNEQLLKRLFPK